MNENVRLTLLAILIAIIAPLFLMNAIYPAFQVFLPEGCIVLTVPLRITATVVMAIIDYALAMTPLVLVGVPWVKKVWPHIICVPLTLAWNFVIAVLWYVASI